MRKPDRPQSGQIFRCAIYTRKSSDDGLEQEFNSLDAQREACEAYVTSQRHAGWIALPEMYDDGGLSGGTIERPALQRLLSDIKAGKVQIIVVYKVDRLTRSLADFAKIVDVLDAHDASFVSVTQQFNTTTSMGRLTLNMLLSFAQFEREMLQNWLYRGNVAHKEKIYPGQHEAIIAPELWQAVQDRLAAGRRDRSMAVGAEAPSLLSGLIFDSEGARLSPTHAVKKGKRYRYYVSTALITRGRSEHPKGRRIPAGDIEGLVLDRLRALFASGAQVSDAVAPLGLDAATQRAVLDRSAKLAERWTKLASLELRERVRSLVQQIQIGEAQILVWLNRTAIVSSVMPGAPRKPTDC